MKAMQFQRAAGIEASPLRPAELPPPVQGDDGVLIRVRACGVCHTDLHVIEGELPARKSPLTPGHQIVGVVEQCGGRVTTPRIGERVGVAWLYRTCEMCEFCDRGEENLCNHAQFTGYDVDGGFAEYVAAPADFVYALPEQFSDESAAPLLCAGIIGFRALRLSGIKPGGRLGLFGFGASAYVTIQVARHRGCEVYVFSRSDHHRKLGENLGAVWTGTPDQLPPKQLDSVISFAPAGELVPAALRVLRKGGILALAGVYMTPVPRFDYSLLYHERTIRSVANSTRQDGRDFLRIAAEIPVRTEVEVFSLDEANTVLQLLKAGKIRGAGVLKIS